MFTLSSSALFTAPSTPALNASYRFPHGLFSYGDPHLSASQRLNSLPTLVRVHGGAAGRAPSVGSTQGESEHRFLPPDLEMLSNVRNLTFRGIAFSAFSALCILDYERIYNFGGQMSAILFHESLFFMNLYSALLSLPFSVYFFAILLYFSSSWLFSHFILSLSFFSSAALPAFHYCHLFSQPLNPWCCSNWQTGFKSTFESACLFK